jgi:hypothetical protein
VLRLRSIVQWVRGSVYRRCTLRCTQRGPLRCVQQRREERRSGLLIQGEMPPNLSTFRRKGPRLAAIGVAAESHESGALELLTRPPCASGARTGGRRSWTACTSASRPAGAWTRFRAPGSGQQVPPSPNRHASPRYPGPGEPMCVDPWSLRGLGR